MQLPWLHKGREYQLLKSVVTVFLVLSGFIGYAQVSYRAFELELDLEKKGEMAYDLFHYYVRHDLDSIKIMGVHLLLCDGVEEHPLALAMARRAMGSYQIRTGNQEEGLILLKKAASYFEKQEDYMQCCEVYTEIGNGFFLKEEHTAALNAYETSLKLGVHSPDPTSSFNGMLGLGRVNLKLGDTTKAIFYFNEYRSKSLNLNKYEAASDASALLGELYLKLGEKEKGIKLLRETLTYSRKSGSEVHLSHAYTNMGIYYFTQDELDSSLYFFNEALRLRENLNHKRYVVESLFNLGDYYAGIGSPVKAELYYLRSIALAKEHELLQDQIDGYDAILLLYENESNQELTAFRKTRDSLQLIGESRAKAEDDIVNFALSTLNAKSSNQSKLRDGNSIYFLVGFGIVGLVLSMLLIRKLN